ncbi:unnamed protein product [Effrenium voratum]|uniref:Uncharacterized protein n=1 Tax=Effrenium voratum TaxID=2562239 RepID=A0AA36HYL0_9DINO|nr:unnamed protein product [Effrenium voratum]CAJ1442950.1 unnamed protein product [Effrenium voratum]
MKAALVCALLFKSRAEPLLEDDECASRSCALNALQKKVAKMTCKDVVPGDACYGEVMWAKKEGIRQHPNWYPGLTPDSTTADFQEIVHSHKPGKCPPPCVSVDSCHTALPGEKCYSDVQWAKQHGIREHPGWYHGLSAASTDFDFQLEIHTTRPDKCPMPCNTQPGAPAEPEVPEVAPEPELPAPVPEPELPEEVPEVPEEPEEVVEVPMPTVIPETQAPTQAPTEAPQTETEAPRAPSPCHQQDQHEREACEQGIIRAEQLAREQAERAEQEAQRQHDASIPLDVKQNEIIEEIGGPPTEGGLPDFSEFDPDS